MDDKLSELLLAGHGILSAVIGRGKPVYICDCKWCDNFPALS